MNEATTKELLALLSSQFGVCVPGFRFNRAARGLYYPAIKTVTIARPYQNWNGKRTCEHSLLHEFAHHLADERAIKIGVKRDGHGNRFKNALWESGNGVLWRRPQISVVNRIQNRSCLRRAENGVCPMKLLHILKDLWTSAENVALIGFAIWTGYRLLEWLTESGNKSGRVR